VLQKELNWTISGGQLRVGDDTFDCGDVTDIRVEWAPTMAAGSQFLCHIQFRKGMDLTVPSAHYRSFADFEPRLATFRPFVLALAEHVAEANPSSTFSSGSGTSKYYANVAALVVSFILLVIVLLLVSPGWGTLLGLIGFVVLFAVPMSLSWFLANKPKSKLLSVAKADGSLAHSLPEN
jgi:hypothetical protein